MAVMTRWDPMRDVQQEMGRMQRQMERFFGQWGGFPVRPRLAVAYPAVNLWEDDDFVYAEAEMPGVKMESLEISVTGPSQFTIKGERKQPEVQKAEWHRQERGFGPFERSVMLPVSVDTDKVEARMNEGVLTVKLAKRPEAKPRKIAVKAV